MAERPHVSELAAATGLTVSAIYYRLQQGMTVEQILSTPPRLRDENLAGRTFGDLVVLKRAGFNSVGKRQWKCRCACGVVKDIVAADLKSGRAQSCGHRIGTTATERSIARRRDLVGQTFGNGNVRVLRLGDTKVGSDGRPRFRWVCLCGACGSEFQAPANALKRGQITSCGCKRRTRGQDRARRFDVMGKKLTLRDMKDLSGVGVSTLAARIERGMLPMQAMFAPFGRRVPKERH